MNTQVILPALRILASLLLLASVACDRRIEPFSPDEQPRQPDLAKIFPAGAERAAEVTAELPAAPGQAGGRGAPPVGASAAGAVAAAESGPPITGTVEIAPELAGRVPSGAVLFLMARRAEAGPPLAAKRIANPQFPMAFSIGPEDRMMQQVPFAGPVRITARIDADSNATTRTPGDLLGAAEGTPEPGARGVVVRIDGVVGEESALAGAPSAPASPSPPPSSLSAAGEPPPIEGTITLAPDLADRVPGGAVLFLIARTGAGGPPLAVKRITAPQFPLAFSIGPQDRMIQARPFAGAIRISARIDSDGNAMSRTPGDLSGASAGIHSPGDRNVLLVIDEVEPVS